MIGTLVRSDGEAKDIRSFYFRVPDFSYVPGQYVMLAFPDVPDVKRAFSVVGQDGDDIQITIKKHGLFTTRLFDTPIGETFNVLGPYGRFVLPKIPASLVFIAGGIGITPLLSLTRFIEASDGAWDVHIFYSVKDRAQMAFLEYFKGINDSRIKVHLLFTRDPVRPDPHISAEVVRAQVPDLVDRLIYVCGPGPMIRSLRTGLVERGIDDERVRSEEF